MSYNTIYKCAYDQPFRNRVSSCVAQEGSASPELVMGQLIWPIASRTDIEAAYASALAAGNPNPGGDEAVITDQMILSAVQAEGIPAP